MLRIDARRDSVLLAGLQWLEAAHQSVLAQERKKEAEQQRDQAQITQSLFLARLARERRS